VYKIFGSKAKLRAERSATSSLRNGTTNYRCLLCRYSFESNVSKGKN